MSQAVHRDEPRSSRYAAALLAVAMSLLLAGCGGLPVGGPGELEDIFNVTVVITNVGNGVGTVQVVFSIGTTQQPCPAALGPGESCSPFVESFFKVESVTLEAQPGEGSEFVGWDEDCTGTDGECTIINDLVELDIRFVVNVRFDLEPVV